MPQPQTALRLRQLVSDPSHTLSQVVDAVAMDPMLAAAVLRLANSPSLSRGQTITGLTTAITRIGERDLERLALASGLGAATTAPGPLGSLRRRAMQDALTGALVCERLGPALGLEPEACFIEGLLHDVGQLVALGTMELIVSQMPRVDARSTEAWLALADQHHVRLGTMVAGRWQLPGRVRQVIELHHEPEVGAADAATLTRISDSTVALLRSGASLTPSHLPWLERVPEERREELLAKLGAVPSLLAALEGERTTSDSSLVLSPAPREAPAQGLWLPARLSGNREGEALLLSPNQFLLRTKSRLPDNHLVEIRVELPEGQLQLWVRVTFSGRAGVDGVSEAEVTAFAPTPEVSERMESLWAAMELLEVAA